MPDIGDFGINYIPTSYKLYEYSCTLKSNARLFSHMEEVFTKFVHTGECPKLRGHEGSLHAKRGQILLISSRTGNQSHCVQP